jgi:hypothetical protein
VNVLQGIWRDLIDKRLWPVALGLVLVIVAVPVVLARTGAPADEGLSAGAVVAGAESLQGPRQAVIVQADPGTAPIEGSLRNPFADAPAPAAAGTQGDTAGSETGKAVASAGAPGSSDGSQPGAPGDTGTTSPKSDGGSAGDGSSGDAGKTGGKSGGKSTTKSKGSGENGYDVSLRFGTDGAMKSYKAVPRLTPLPSADTPSLVYLGVLSGGKTAVFMIAVDVTAVGDGTCRPSASRCETLEMKEGETMFLDVTEADGQAKQYQLDVTDIKKIGKGGATISAEEAGRSAGGTASEAASAVEAGREAVQRARRRGAADTLDRYRFVRARGVVVRRSPREVRRARARARAASSGALRVRRGGHVVAAGL